MVEGEGEGKNRKKSDTEKLRGKNVRAKGREKGVNEREKSGD